MACPQALCDLPLGQSAVVRDIRPQAANKQRLRELGLIDGAAVEALFRSPAGDPTAFVQLASQSSRTEADRSLRYAVDRWGKLFGDARPEVVAAPGEIFRVRLPLRSLERANAICAAVKADGGGCYVTAAGS